MSSIKSCPSCRAPFSADWKQIEDGQYECPYCGNIHDMDALDAEESSSRRVKAEEFARIYRMLENINFTSADSELRDLRKKYPNDSKVYFLSALSNNCICYTENDTESDKWPFEKIPTLNNVRFEDIEKTEYVQKAIELAKTAADREYYSKVFQYVEKVRKQIVTAYQSGENRFDVFISVKVNKVDETTKKTVVDEHGDPIKTTDYALASDLYDFIKDNIPGCKVFLSERMQDKFVGKEYEHIIFSALNSAKVFILVSNSTFNVEWHWVRNEWMRYLYLMNGEHDDRAAMRSFVFVTKGMNPNDLPAEFRKKQAIIWGKVGAETNLINFIKEGVRGKHEAKTLSAQTFTTEVSVMEDVPLEEMELNTGTLNTSYDKMSTDLVEEIDSYIEDLEKASKRIANNDLRGKSLRNDAFDGLRYIAERNKEAYKAKLYLLLEDTDFASPNEYFTNLGNLADNPDFCKKYFDFADEKDAKKSIAAVCDQITKSNEAFKMNNALKLVVLPYLNIIPKETAKDMLDNFKRVFGLSLKECSLPPFKRVEMVNNILTLNLFLDGNDPKKYINARKSLINIASANGGLGKSADSEWVNKAIEEILKVNKGDVQTRWVEFMINSGNGVLSPNDLANSLFID